MQQKLEYHKIQIHPETPGVLSGVEMNDLISLFKWAAVFVSFPRDLAMLATGPQAHAWGLVALANHAKQDNRTP